VQVDLRQLAHVRSGDKGDTSNVAVIAYRPDTFFAALVEQLTVEAVLAFYNGAIRGPAQRYVVPGLGVMNFVLDGALGGGVSRSIAMDQYGKALSAALLGFQITIPDDSRPLVRRPDLLPVVT
jgi:uncharacterized membrane protein